MIGFRKQSIIEIQKLNIQNTNEAIVDILKAQRQIYYWLKDFYEVNYLAINNRVSVVRCKNKISKLLISYLKNKLLTNYTILLMFDNLVTKAA